jgi:hypothetical protein
MVHLPGPIYPPNRHLKNRLERLLEQHPDWAIADIERLVPDCRNLSRDVLEEMIAKIRKPLGSAAPINGSEQTTVAPPGTFADPIRIDGSASREKFNDVA